MTNQLFRRSQPGRVVSAALLLALGLGATSSASGQLTPDRTYYGVNRPVPMTIGVPAGKAGSVTVQLFAPAAKEPTAKAEAAAGPVDLVTLFPQTWTGAPALMFAQLFVGEEAIGAPVVLQPLTPAPMAIADPSSGGLQWRDGGGGRSSGLRAYVEKVIVLNTTFGDITVQLRPDHAPNTCWNFMQLVNGGFYSDITFHRIIGPRNRRAGFMAQVGDPTGTGSGGPGYVIDLERSRLPHDFGVLSMARTNDPNTNGSQVFLCFSREGTSFLDGNYCAFAQTIAGGDAIVKLEAAPCDPASPEQSRPVEPAPRIISAKLVDAAPFGKGLSPMTRAQAENKPAQAVPVPPASTGGDAPPAKK